MKYSYASSILIIICVLVIAVSCYRTHTALNSIVFTNIPMSETDAVAEYYFGKCASRFKELVIHEHISYEQIVGNLRIQAYINVTEIPTCVYVKAKSALGDMVKYNAHKFTLCLSRIVYSYHGGLFTYYFYEWYFPVEMHPGIDWDLYFYIS